VFARREPALSGVEGNLGEPREMSGLLRHNDRAFGSLHFRADPSPSAALALHVKILPRKSNWNSPHAWRISSPRRNLTVSRLAIWAQLEAKPGKEKEVEQFLKSAQPLAEREPGTVSWYAIKMGPSKYGIFDTFADENGRNAHLNGEIAKALFAKAKDLFAKPPDIAKPELLAAKSTRS
jgi:quinol monooxygenase YgiN